MLNFRTIKLDFATKDRERIRKYLLLIRLPLYYRVLDYISQVIGFQWTTTRKKRDRGFGIKTQVLKSSRPIKVDRSSETPYLPYELCRDLELL